MSAGDILPDGSIQCAWHGARFDCTTGEVKQIPATDPLPVFEVKVEGDKIFVGGICPRAEKGYRPSIAEVPQ
jgi:3-phenylpropionate/trans-cinnamate dioxygenase ferredoxin subunit